ncbi:hypothetical protein RUM44_000656 [Polyplax serrata]|uniref:Uncharacterized protein n=1 Tax=Polyplax serrata TaxID=468196 RepID=A0ABR1B5Z9_POLSC
MKKSMRLCLGTKAFPFTDCTLSIIPTAGFNLIFVTCPISFEYEGIIENESYNIGRAVLRCCKSSVRSNFRDARYGRKETSGDRRKQKKKNDREETRGKGQCKQQRNPKGEKNFQKGSEADLLDFTKEGGSKTGKPGEK